MDGTAPFCGVWGTHEVGGILIPFRSSGVGRTVRQIIARAQRAFHLSLGVERGTLSLSLLSVPRRGCERRETTVFAPFQRPLFFQPARLPPMRYHPQSSAVSPASEKGARVTVSAHSIVISLGSESLTTDAVFVILPLSFPPVGLFDGPGETESCH